VGNDTHDDAAVLIIWVTEQPSSAPLISLCPSYDAFDFGRIVSANAISAMCMRMGANCDGGICHIRLSG